MPQVPGDVGRGDLARDDRDRHEALRQRPGDEAGAAQRLEDRLGHRGGGQGRVSRPAHPRVQHRELDQVARAGGEQSVEPRAGEVGRRHVARAQRAAARVGGPQDVPPTPHADDLRDQVQRDSGDQPTDRHARGGGEDQRAGAYRPLHSGLDHARALPAVQTRRRTSVNGVTAALDRGVARAKNRTHADRLPSAAGEGWHLPRACPVRRTRRTARSLVRRPPPRNRAPHGNRATPTGARWR